MAGVNSETASGTGELLPTNGALLSLLQNQEDSSAWQAGWREFMQLYRPVIVQYARRSGLQPVEAEDVMQEIVMGVAQKLPLFRYEPERCSFKTWLFRVARNKVVDHLRRRRSQGGEREVRGIEGEVLAEVADDAQMKPDEAWDREFEHQVLRTALQRVGQRVKPMTMRLYLYHVVDGHSVPETVAAFRDAGVRSEDVYQAKSRIQEQLATQLKKLQRGL